MTKYYHVWITLKGTTPPQRRRDLERNLSFEDLETRFLIPYRTGRSLVVNGRTITPDELERVRVFETERRLGHGVQIQWNTIPNVTSRYISVPAGATLETTSRVEQQLRPPTDAQDVFVVHGRNSAARNAMFEFLRSIGLHPLEWSEATIYTGKPSPYIGEILDAAFSKAHAFVVLFTPDDEARLRQEFRVDGDPPHETELTGQARPNVFFEAGMAMGRYPEWTVFVELGSLRPFTDTAGLHVIRMDGSSQRRQELAQRLEAAGCPVRLEGTDWHTAGDFGAVLASIVDEAAGPVDVAEGETTTSGNSRLSDDAMELLTEATQGESGEIEKLRTQAGLIFRTRYKTFGEFGDRRSEARWAGALNDLLSCGFVVEDEVNPDGLFNVTREGWATIDALDGLE